MKRNYILFILALSTGNVLVAMESPKAMPSITLTHTDAPHNEPLLFSSCCSDTLVKLALEKSDWFIQLCDTENLSEPVSGKIFSKALTALRTIADDAQNTQIVIDRALKATQFIVTQCNSHYTDEIETNPKFINNYDESANLAFVARAIPLEYWQDQNRFTPEARSKLFKLLNSDACKQFTVSNVMGSDAGALSLIRSFATYQSIHAESALSNSPEGLKRLSALKKHPSQYIKTASQSASVTPSVGLIFDKNCTATALKALLSSEDFNFAPIFGEAHSDGIRLSEFKGDIDGNRLVTAMAALGRNIKTQGKIAQRALVIARFLLFNCHKIYKITEMHSPDTNLDAIEWIAAVVKDDWKKGLNPEAQHAMFSLLGARACAQFSSEITPGKNPAADLFIKHFRESRKHWGQEWLNLAKKPAKKEGTLFTEQKDITSGLYSVPHDIKESSISGVYYLADSESFYPIKKQNSRWIKPAIFTALFGGTALTAWYTYPAVKQMAQQYNPLPSLRNYATQTMGVMSQRFGFGSIQ